MPAPAWAVGMQRLGPGVYMAPDETAHFSAVELCEHLHWPATPASVEAANRIFEEVAREAWGNIPITRKDEPA